MSPEDAIAAATLACARCAELKTTSIQDYFSHFVKFEQLFAEHRAEQARIRDTRDRITNLELHRKLGG